MGGGKWRGGIFGYQLRHVRRNKRGGINCQPKLGTFSGRKIKTVLGWRGGGGMTSEPSTTEATELGGKNNYRGEKIKNGRAMITLSGKKRLQEGESRERMPLETAEGRDGKQGPHIM